MKLRGLVVCLVVWLASIAVWWTTGLLWGTLVAIGLSVADFIALLISTEMKSRSEEVCWLGMCQKPIPVVLLLTLPLVLLWLIVGIVWTAAVHL
jgi:hypothetical protein